MAGRGFAGLGRAEGHALHEREVATHAIDHGDFVAVLQVFADARQIHAHLDAVSFQLFTRADAGELEQLRGVEGAGAEDHLTPR